MAFEGQAGNPAMTANRREVVFKPGDKVVVIDGPQKGEMVRTLKNRVNSVFFTSFPVRIKNQHYDAKGIWYAGEKVCLRHATPEEIAAAPKPLQRGDLVTYRDLLWIVYSEGEDVDGYYWITSLTGEPETCRVAIHDLTQVGSIRKKIKRMQAQTESESQDSLMNQLQKF